MEVINKNNELIIEFDTIDACILNGAQAVLKNYLYELVINKGDNDLIKNTEDSIEFIEYILMLEDGKYNLKVKE